MKLTITLESLVIEFLLQVKPKIFVRFSLLKSKRDFLNYFTAVDLMKKLLIKDPKQRISAKEALEHEWIVFGGAYMSPQTNTPVYLLLAQENMKKVSQE